MEPVLLTSTKMKQNYFNFVHLNFSLCMIVPKSFSNLRCFAKVSAVKISKQKYMVSVFWGDTLYNLWN